MNREKNEILNDLAQLCVANFLKCQVCTFCHNDNTCFFAVDCLTNNFSHFKRYGENASE